MDKNNINEEVTITPIIRDLERLFNKIISLVIGLFVQLGKLIKNFIRFCLKNFKILFVLTILGGIVGFLSIYIFPRNYSSNLVLEPNVDQLPVPNRKKIDLSPYLETWKTHHGKSTLNISTQRGCPYTCQWCSTAVYGQSYRRRSPKLVVDEIEGLIQQYEPDALWFVDDVFTVSHKWIAAFSDEMKKRNISIPFECITRAERLNETVIQDLKSAGCFRIWIGAESGSQRIIDLMQRQVNIDKVVQMMKLTKSYGIETGTFIMLGYPTETKEDIQLTIDYLKVANPDNFTITVAYPIKGTGLFNQIEPLITKDPTWSKNTDRDIEFQRTYPRKYYDYAVRKVVNELNFHKTKLQGKIFSKKAIVFKLKSILSHYQMRYIEQ